ncbi:Putative single-stranded DNA binding protein [Arachis hypogaea]|nr:Putative single-stranded DNA binding protein [Arachis hypogaea]
MLLQSNLPELETQPQYSVADEINVGIVPMRTIKEVLNMTQKTSCWIVGNVVSIEVGKDEWSYISCKTCLKKVVENKDRYQLQIIVTNGSSCMKLLLWNKEAEKMVGKVAVKVKELCDSAVESNGDSSYQAPAKRSCADACDGSTVKASVSVDVQVSANKTFKRNCGKKKMD